MTNETPAAKLARAERELTVAAGAIPTGVTAEAIRDDTAPGGYKEALDAAVAAAAVIQRAQQTRQTVSAPIINLAACTVELAECYTIVINADPDDDMLDEHDGDYDTAADELGLALRDG